MIKYFNLIKMLKYEKNEQSSIKKKETITLKVITIGSTSVGKTSIIRVIAGEEFLINPLSTNGVDFKTIKFEVENWEVKLQIWDTCGLEQFLSCSKSYYRLADIVLLVYDINRRESFEKLDKFLEQIEIVLHTFGNKSSYRE